jgi:Leucine-rich repeat (LRR) protein
MQKHVEIIEPGSVMALYNLALCHPEAGFKWDFSKSLKVIVSGTDRFAMQVEDGCLIGLDLTNDRLKGTLVIDYVPTLEYLRINCPNANRVKLSRLSYLNHLVMENLDLAEDEEHLVFKSLPRLRTLRINASKLTDLSPMVALNAVRSLNLKDNSIKSIAPLAKLTKLTQLTLADNFIQDVSYLAELKRLKEVDLSNNELKELGQLYTVKTLKALSIGQNPFGGYEFLKSFAHLEELRLNGAGPMDLEHLEALPGLKLLELRYNELESLRFLKALTSLTYLDLSDNRLENLDGLKVSDKLVHLLLRNNRITDISALLKLKKLKELNLGHNLIEDLSGLKKLNQLEDLDLRYNRLVNLAPIKDLPKLKKVNLSFNPRIAKGVLRRFYQEFEEMVDDAFIKETCDEISARLSRPKITSPGLTKPPDDPADLLKRLLNPPKDPQLREELFKAFIQRVLSGELAQEDYPSALVSKTEAGEPLFGQDPEDKEPDSSDFLSELKRLLGEDESSADASTVFRDLIPEAYEPSADESPEDEGERIYHSLDEIPDLPPELTRIFKQICGDETTRIKIKTIKKDASGSFPGLPKGTVVIRCQVESQPGSGSNDDDVDEVLKELEEMTNGFDSVSAKIVRPERGRSNLFFDRSTKRSDFSFPFIRRKSGPDDTYTSKDEEEFRRIQKLFYFLDFNPTKFSKH